jgi:hypothetical protein
MAVDAVRIDGKAIGEVNENRWHEAGGGIGLLGKPTVGETAVEDVGAPFTCGRVVAYRLRGKHAAVAHQVDWRVRNDYSGAQSARDKRASK